MKPLWLLRLPQEYALPSPGGAQPRLPLSFARGLPDLSRATAHEINAGVRALTPEAAPEERRRLSEMAIAAAREIEEGDFIAAAQGGAIHLFRAVSAYRFEEGEHCIFAEYPLAPPKDAPAALKELARHAGKPLMKLEGSEARDWAARAFPSRHHRRARRVQWVVGVILTVKLAALLIYQIKQNW